MVLKGLMTRVSHRRVHITQATLDCLGNEYEVEPGEGHLRSQYLRDHNVTSYFIIPPPRRRKVRHSTSAVRRPHWGLVALEVIEME